MKPKTPPSLRQTRRGSLERFDVGLYNDFARSPHLPPNRSSNQTNAELHLILNSDLLGRTTFYEGVGQTREAEWVVQFLKGEQ